MLTPATRAALERALAMPRESWDLVNLVHEIVPQQSYRSFGQWLLNADAAHRAAVREAEERGRNAMLAVVMQSNPASYVNWGRAGASMMRDGIIRELQNTIAALRQDTNG